MFKGTKLKEVKIPLQKEPAAEAHWCGFICTVLKQMQPISCTCCRFIHLGFIMCLYYMAVFLYVCIIVVAGMIFDCAILK